MGGKRLAGALIALALAGSGAVAAPAGAVLDDWLPPVDIFPPAGTFLYVDGDPNDHVTGGEDFFASLSDAEFHVDDLFAPRNGESHVGFRVYGDTSWDVELAVPDGPFRAGTFTGATRYPFNVPGVPGLSTQADSSCSFLVGAFTVDEVERRDERVSALTVRWEQRCADQNGNNVQGQLRGMLRWDIDDVAPPVVPLPAPLWQPPLGTVPPTGDYLYIEGDPADYPSSGRRHLYGPTLSPRNEALTVSHEPGVLHVRVGEGIDSRFDSWTVDLAAGPRGSELEPRYYPGVMRYPLHNPAKGGLAASSAGGCNGLLGWFAIDAIGFHGDGSLDYVLARFEQHCESAEPALRGKLRWGDPPVDITLDPWINAAPTIERPWWGLTVPSFPLEPVPQVQLYDDDAFGGILTLTLATDVGTVRLPSQCGACLQYWTPAHGKVVTASGRLGDLNVALRHLTYTARRWDYRGPDRLRVWVNDNANSGLGIAKVAAITWPITVFVPPNTPPAITVPTDPADVPAGGWTSLPLRVDDWDADVDGIGTISVMITTNHGWVGLQRTTGLQLYSRSYGSRLAFSGTQAAINNAIRDLSYAPMGYRGPADILVYAYDNGHTGAHGAKWDQETFTVNSI